MIKGKMYQSSFSRSVCTSNDTLCFCGRIWTKIDKAGKERQK